MFENKNESTINWERRTSEAIFTFSLDPNDVMALVAAVVDRGGSDDDRDNGNGNGDAKKNEATIKWWGMGREGGRTRGSRGKPSLLEGFAPSSAKRSGTNGGAAHHQQQHDVDGPQRRLP